MWNYEDLLIKPENEKALGGIPLRAISL